MSLLENQLLLRQRTEARLSTQKLTRLLSPRDPRYFRVASLLAAHQDYVAAIPLMENVQREFPQSYEVNFNLALAFFDTQAYEKAAETLGPLVRHDPQAEAYNLLAMVEEQPQRLIPTIGWHTSFWARFTKRHLHFRTPSLTSSGLTRN